MGPREVGPGGASQVSRHTDQIPAAGVGRPLDRGACTLAFLLYYTILLCQRSVKSTANDDVHLNASTRLRGDSKGVDVLAEITKLREELQVPRLRTGVQRE